MTLFTMNDFINFERDRNVYRRREVVCTTPLHTAMSDRKNSFASVKEHLRNGVHPDIKDKLGETALHRAVANGLVEAIGALLQVNAEVNIHNARGNTALHQAFIHGFNINIVNQLCDAGASFASVNNKGDTPLHIAIRSKLCNARGIKSFLRRGIAINARNNKGRTALIEAAFMSKDTSILEALLDHGADVNALDPRGHSALHYAISYKDIDTAKLLFKYGASPCSENLKCCFADEDSVFLLIQYLALQNFEFCRGSPSLNLVWDKVVSDLRHSAYFRSDKLKEMFISCFQELDDMRSDFIHDDFTMYDFVRNRLFTNRFQCSEPEFVIEYFASKLSAGTYKSYLNLIFTHFSKRDLSRCLSTQFISHTLPCGRVVILNSWSLLDVSVHLSKQDVKNFLTACFRLDEQ